MSSRIAQDLTALHPLTDHETGQEMSWVAPLVSWCKDTVGMSVPIKIDWNRRFTSRMGCARTVFLPGVMPRKVASAVVIFTASALWRRASPEERRAVVIHEVAHILANALACQHVGHGHAWKSMMRRLGASPDRCHSVNRNGLYRGRKPLRTAQVPVKQELAVFLSAPEVSWDDKLVRFTVDGASLIGRVVRHQSGSLRVALIGDHVTHVYGRFRDVSACDAQPI